MNEVLAYRFQQIITGSTATKLGFVLLLCMPYVLASATFYRSLSSESWFQATYKTVRNLVDMQSRHKRVCSVRK